MLSLAINFGNMFNSLLYAYIQHDSRNVKRTRASYHVTAEFFNKRYSAMLPADLVQNKTILDLGCGLGAAGAWALLNGANRYVGIDIQDSCVRKAALLASECGLAGRAEFHCVALEDVDFSKFPRADILIAAGVLFTNPDVFWDVITYLKLSSTSNHRRF